MLFLRSRAYVYTYVSTYVHTYAFYSVAELFRIFSGKRQMKTQSETVGTEGLIYKDCTVRPNARYKGGH
jgi:hypothetical protein